MRPPAAWIAGAATAALALPAPAPAIAQDQQVLIYGRLNIGIEALKSTSDDPATSRSVSRLSNYRSVLGFSGSEDLGGGVKAIFQVEGTLSPDTGAGSPAARDTRIGIEGPYGTLFAGNWTLPYNSATAGLDPFYPTTAGDMSIMGNGSASSADNVSDNSSFDRRQQNSIHYWTPSWNGVSLRIARGVNEERPAGGARPALTSAALIAERGDLYATLACELHHDYQAIGHDDHAAKAALAYTLASVRLAAAAEWLHYSTPTGDLTRRDWYLSATRQWGRHGLRFGLAHAGDGRGASAQQVGFVRAGADTGASHWTAGYDYTFSKRTSVFAFYTRLRNQRNGVTEFAINSLGPGAAPAAHGIVQSGVALGIRHAF